MYMYMHVYMYASMYVCTHGSTGIRVCTYMHVYMYIYIYAHDIYEVLGHPVYFPGQPGATQIRETESPKTAPGAGPDVPKELPGRLH